jgi:ribosome assembly protein YihI (activator of Der GTPase)
VVSDEHNMLVALVRQSGETLHQLLDRLERALGPAIEDQIFVDEINEPSSPPPKSRRR